MRYLHDLVAQAVATLDADIGIVLASACCAVHPADLIRDVQRLHGAGLLADTGVDFLDTVKVLLEVRHDLHLKDMIASGRYELLYEPVAILEEVFAESGWMPYQARLAPGPTHAGRRRSGRAEAEWSDGTPHWHPARAGETVVRTGPKVGRNDPCLCGSGRKFKHCCGR